MSLEALGKTTFSGELSTFEGTGLSKNAQNKGHTIPSGMSSGGQTTEDSSDLISVGGTLCPGPLLTMWCRSLRRAFRTSLILRMVLPLAVEFTSPSVAPKLICTRFLQSTRRRDNGRAAVAAVVLPGSSQVGHCFTKVGLTSPWCTISQGTPTSALTSARFTTMGASAACCCVG